MEINVVREDGYAVVDVSGRVTRENQAELRTRLEEVVSPETRGIALNLEMVEYLDSAGLGCCSATRKFIDETCGGSLVVFGASPSIEKMWKLIRMDLVIPMFQTRDEAVAAFRLDDPG